MIDLSLHFLMLFARRALWAYVFPYFWASRRSRLTPVQRNRPGASKDPAIPRGFSLGFGSGRGTLEEGLQVPLCLMPVTCHLSPVTCHLYLYLST